MRLSRGRRGTSWLESRRTFDRAANFLPRFVQTAELAQAPIRLQFKPCAPNSVRWQVLLPEMRATQGECRAKLGKSEIIDLPIGPIGGSIYSRVSKVIKRVAPRWLRSETESDLGDLRILKWLRGRKVVCVTYSALNVPRGIGESSFRPHVHGCNDALSRNGRAVEEKVGSVTATTESIASLERFVRKGDALANVAGRLSHRGHRDHRADCGYLLCGTPCPL
jgi:hypothetical protein